MQKWNDDPKAGALCPRKDDHNIFFATMRKSGKDNSGEKIWRRVYASSTYPLEDEESVLNPPAPVERRVGMEGDFLQDIHGHLVVDHDLYNHEWLTEDGIAEAFIEFAKKEKLSFFKSSSSVPPFDAEKYQRLMDGLEAMEVLLSQIDECERIDSEFFKKEFVYPLQRLDKVEVNLLQKIAEISDGNHLAISEEFLFDENVGVRYLRGQDISAAMFIDDRNKVFIPETAYASMSRSHIFKDDILITIVGANTGFVGWAYNPPDKLTANCKLGIARPKEVIPGYLYSFLASEYGQKQIIRSKRGGGQTDLILPDSRKLKIARFSESLEKKIHHVADLAHSLFHIKSKKIYQQAEDLLLSELNLKDWQPNEETITVQSFVKSYLASGRLDAEYYQPKYDDLYKALESSCLYKGWQLIKLSSLSSIFKYGTSEPFEYLE